MVSKTRASLLPAQHPTPQVLGRGPGWHPLALLLPQGCSMRASSGCQVPSPGSQRSVTLLREVGDRPDRVGVGGGVTAGAGAIGLLCLASPLGEDPLVEGCTPHDLDAVAGVLKLYFRSLDPPLFPPDLFGELLASAGETQA